MEWNGIRAQRSAKPIQKLFLGQMDVPDSTAVMAAALGSLRIVSTTMPRLLLEHEGSDRCQGHPQGSYCFLLQRAGSAELQQYGNRAALGCGDITLYDPSRAWRYKADGEGEVILVHVPSRLLTENLPGAEGLCGRRLRCNEGLTATVGAMAQMLVSQLRDGLDELSRQRVANHLLGMFTSCYSPAIDSGTSGSAVMAGRLWRVKAFVEENLRNPDLSPALVASEMRLSPRYLRMIFAASDEPILTYIMRRRLEECARQLADPRWRGHSITEIAFAWGFNSAPHFTRSFRARFGMSPRQYRQKELPTAEPLAA